MPPRRLSILLAAGIFPPDDGGPATYVPEIAEALMRRGHRIVGVVTLADEPVAAAALRTWPFPVIRLRRRQNRLLRMAAAMVRLTALARRADVVFANSLVAEPAAAAWLARKPLVIKVVGDPVWERACGQGQPLGIDAFQSAALPPLWAALRRFNEWLHRRASRVIVPSRYLAGIVAGWGVAMERIRVVPNAALLPPLPASRSPVTHDVVTVCRLVPWKGVDRLIRIAAASGRSLLVVGEGPDRPRLEALAWDRGAKVTFLGRRPRAEVPALIASARVFALASDYEGFPHVVLEAMAVGVPVVAFDAGGTGEAVSDGETGLLAPAGDDAMLAAALARVLDTPDLAARLVANAAKSLDRFSVEAMVAATEAVLCEAAAARGQ
jgi:glycosyltransferase involved in cell wall biosynthesis